MIRFLKEALEGTDQDFTRGSLSRGIALLAIPTMLEMAMESTFAIVERCLDTWTIDSLAEVLRRPDWDDSWVHSRGSLIQRLYSHDVYHVSEVNQALGAAGLPLIDLWAWSDTD